MIYDVKNLLNGKGATPGSRRGKHLVGDVNDYRVAIIDGQKF